MREVLKANEMQCPRCHDANSCGDYEGPTCEVCNGEGRVPRVVDVGDELHQILGAALRDNQ